MASFSEHISQAKRNLKYLKESNSKIEGCWDWQVTVCFYVAVHLINAHLAKKADLHYRSHSAVENAINPYNQLSTTKLDDNTFLSYRKLRNFSRRSRYMINDKEEDSSTQAFQTYDKHFCKSVHHLDVLLQFVTNEYQEEFDCFELTCLGLKNGMKHFKETSKA